MHLLIVAHFVAGVRHFYSTQCLLLMNIGSHYLLLMIEQSHPTIRCRRKASTRCYMVNWMDCCSCIVHVLETILLRTNTNSSITTWTGSATTLYCIFDKLNVRIICLHLGLTRLKTNSDKVRISATYL